METDFPDTVEKSGNFDSLDFQMKDESKGVNQYIFSLGGATNQIKSNLGKGSIIICGKEIVSLNIEGAHNFPVKKDGTATKVLDSSEIESFFKVEPGSESHSDCGIESY